MGCMEVRYLPLYYVLLILVMGVVFITKHIITQNNAVLVIQLVAKRHYSSCTLVTRQCALFIKVETFLQQ